MKLRQSAVISDIFLDNRFFSKVEYNVEYYPNESHIYEIEYYISTVLFCSEYRAASTSTHAILLSHMVPDTNTPVSFSIFAMMTGRHFDVKTYCFVQNPKSDIPL